MLPDLLTDAHRVADLALAEDGARDVTTDLLGVGGTRASGRIEYRRGGVIAGLPYANAVLERVGVGAEWRVAEGDAAEANAVIGRVHGPLHALLRAERPMLNLLQRASGIATATRRVADHLEGTGCRVLHTRKTAPGLRAFDIRAVLAGGGAMHRAGLDDAVLVKDNHWQAMRDPAADLPTTVRAAAANGVFVTVEVDCLEQVEIAARSGAARLLVDNQTPATLEDWVAHARAIAPAIEIEASGNVTERSARAFAAAGADYVSIGALTHSVIAADIALELDASPADAAR